jgi:hypothetical protein
LFLIQTVFAFGAVVACSDSSEETSTDTAASGGDTITVSGAITADTTWVTGKTYVLESHVFVENATLTIEPGVVVKGKSGSSLVITTSARLEAAGTAAAPIVFTSNEPAGQRGPGNWGGVVMLGNAPLNVEGGSESIEGFPAGGDRTVYGGSDAAHDCGTLKYARIEFAGYELEKDNELNGLTVGGCGTGTEIDYVQVHLGADDGVEMFGGTANLRHIVITQPDDDGLDWDFGWTGNVQFLVLQQNGLVGDNGIEADSNKNDNDATPRAAPTLWNTTWVGSNAEPGTAGKTQSAFMFRRGTAGTMKNAVVAYFTDFALQVNDKSSTDLLAAGQLSLQSSLWWDNGGATDAVVAKSDVEGVDVAALVATAESGNKLVDPKLTDALNLDAPNFLPAAGSPALSGGATPPAGFDATATYYGAFGTVDWTAGWTAYPAD